MQETKSQPAVRHFRISDDAGNVSNKGGATIAYQAGAEEGTVEYALSHCNPKDNFSRLIGRRASTSRLNRPLRVTVLEMSVEEFEQELNTVSETQHTNNESLAYDLYDAIEADIPAVYVRGQD